MTIIINSIEFKLKFKCQALRALQPLKKTQKYEYSLNEYTSLVCAQKPTTIMNVKPHARSKYDNEQDKIYPICNKIYFGPVFMSVCIFLNFIYIIVWITVHLPWIVLNATSL